MLLEPIGTAARDAVPPPSATDIDERAACRDLRGQIARLDRELTACVRGAFPYARIDGAAAVAPVPGGGPRVLGVAPLEALRDDLAERLRRAREDLARQAAEHDLHRRRLEDMLRDPRSHKWARIARRDIGEPGCGVWQARPRLGLIGMLAGWWHVTVSSGCP